MRSPPRGARKRKLSVWYGGEQNHSDLSKPLGRRAFIAKRSFSEILHGLQPGISWTDASWFEGSTASDPWVDTEFLPSCASHTWCAKHSWGFGNSQCDAATWFCQPSVGWNKQIADSWAAKVDESEITCPNSVFLFGQSIQCCVVTQIQRHAVMNEAGWSRAHKAQVFNGPWDTHKSRRLWLMLSLQDLIQIYLVITIAVLLDIWWSHKSRIPNPAWNLWYKPFKIGDVHLLGLLCLSIEDDINIQLQHTFRLQLSNVAKLCKIHKSFPIFLKMLSVKGTHSFKIPLSQMLSHWISTSTALGPEFATIPKIRPMRSQMGPSFFWSMKNHLVADMAVGQNLENPCSSHQNSWDLWMFIPLKMVLIGIDL